jgi:hypothetical protein
MPLIKIIEKAPLKNCFTSSARSSGSAFPAGPWRTVLAEIYGLILFAEGGKGVPNYV